MEIGNGEVGILVVGQEKEADADEQERQRENEGVFSFLKYGPNRNRHSLRRFRSSRERQKNEIESEEVGERFTEAW